MRRPTFITSAYERELEHSFDNDREAHALLDLINAEFKSDPTSTQCFDARIVERVHRCVSNHKQFMERNLMKGFRQ